MCTYGRGQKYGSARSRHGSSPSVHMGSSGFHRRGNDVVPDDDTSCIENVVYGVGAGAGEITVI